MRHRSQKTQGAGGDRSQRQLRVGEVIRHVLVDALSRGELHDPALQGVSITVTEVRISPDLRNATAFVMPLGGANGPEVVAALRRASGFLRHLIGQQGLTLRHLPHLGFELDTAFDHSQHMDALLRDVAADLKPGEPDDGDDGA